MRKPLALFVLSLLVSGSAAGQATKAATKAAPKFKAIWEPVPFTKDIQLNAISCAGPETCWVAGDKATILFTSDGGTTWQVQVGGDPEGAEEDLAEIFFLDGKHGWAMDDRNKLMATIDGSTWAELGTGPATGKGLWFTSPQTGFFSDNHDSTERSVLNRTNDGGRTWTRTIPCGLDAMIGGLARKLGCRMAATQFVTPQTGFMGGGTGTTPSIAAVSKTTDGGNTWSNSIIPATEHGIDSIHFWSEKDGLVLLASGRTFWTADGGATWTGSLNPPRWRSYYAAAEGKIIVGVAQTGELIGYSFNGGGSFTSRPANLPAYATAVAFPDARHGYLVGQHGMVYRYRIVPIDYTSQGMIGALAP